MNTIDNSTYLKISDRNGIFHVEAPNVALENASILDLIESQVISINMETIASFKIFKGNKKSDRPLLEINKKNDNWYNQVENSLSKEKVDEYLQELSNLKSSFILDKATDSQKKQISSIIKNAEYTISIEDNKANTTDYNISEMIKEFNDIDLKNDDYFIITTSSSSTSYIVKKEFYELFNRKFDYLKSSLPKNSEQH